MVTVFMAGDESQQRKLAESIFHTLKVFHTKVILHKENSKHEKFQDRISSMQVLGYSSKKSRILLFMFQVKHISVTSLSNS